MVSVGFIGLGTMGYPMAGNLARAGIPLTVWNRSPGPVSRLRKEVPSVRAARTPQEAAAGVDVLITMLSDDAAVGDVLFGPGRAGESLRPDSLLLEMSTTSPGLARSVAHRLEGRGVRMLDAPVFGSKAEAENGTLHAVVGGTTEDVETCGFTFETLCSTVRVVGEAGAGSIIKLCGNTVILGMLDLLAEGILLGRANGIGVREVIAGLSDISDIWCPLFDGKGGQILSDDYRVRFALSHALKDLDLAIGSLGTHAVRLPVTNAVRERFGAALTAGLGGDDCAAIIKAYR